MLNSRLPKMKVLKVVSIVLIALVVAAAAGFFLIGYLKPKLGGLLVNTTPGSNVYVNGSFVGKTPYKGTNVAGQVDLKLVPTINDQNLIAYETKINLSPGTETVVDREFGTTEDTSSGDVLSFDRIGGSGAGLIVVSTPDNSQVSIDGEVQGFSPYSLSSITTSLHKISVESPGYTERTMSVKTQTGYKLTVFAKLAESQAAVQPPSPSPTPVATIKTYVLIGNTPTGFLRMRTQPGTGGEEIAELKPGSKYLFLEGDITSGWYKIQYEDPAPGLPDGISGWVSNQFSTIATESGTLK
jgi:hypothetical protein